MPSPAGERIMPVGMDGERELLPAERKRAALGRRRRPALEPSPPRAVAPQVYEFGATTSK
jgi:hypothetical protein